MKTFEELITERSREAAVLCQDFCRQEAPKRVEACMRCEELIFCISEGRFRPRS